MFICDIGNTNATFFNEGRVWKKSIDEFLKFQTSDKVFYICVNENIRSIIKSKKNYIDLEPYIELDTAYKDIGIDRIAACKSISDGIIIDAGSAITVDIMSGGVHLGGFILPGLQAYIFAYKNIAPILNQQINTNIILDALPQNTRDAISYAIIKSIILIIKDCSSNKKIYFTGGDGKYLSKFFQNSIYDKMLVFRSLQEVISRVLQIDLFGKM